jgi:hypothetical protein
MPNTVSTPGVAQTTVPTATQGPVSTLKDVTLRSVIFGKKDLEVMDEGGSKVLKDRVDPAKFDSYINVLKVMAQLSRLVYADLSVIRDVMLNKAFASPDNLAVNNAITAADKVYVAGRPPIPKINPNGYSMKRTPALNAVDGRPMESYTVPPKGTAEEPVLLKYVSSPSDVTFFAISGDQLKANPIFVDTDLVICFKGSSTVDNFKHDLYSQFNPAELSKVMPKGTTATSGIVGNVTGAFVSPLNKSWEILKQTILEKSPKRLFVTGHSLGGAYATVFSFIVAECHASIFPSIESVHLVTFGAPTIVTDKARNTFNTHLDSGFMTLDRVTSFGLVPDVIPGIPAGFSHPGYQPLRTEFQPEKRTGRAYNIDTIRKVYQTGGLLGLGPEKNKYERETKTHMPTRIAIAAKTPVGKGFAHAEYFDMMFAGAMRFAGMKNAGFTGNTFVGEVYESGISWKYVPADSSDVAKPEPGPSETGDLATVGTPPPTGQGRRKTRRSKKASRRRKY